MGFRLGAKAGVEAGAGVRVREGDPVALVAGEELRGIELVADLGELLVENAREHVDQEERDGHNVQEEEEEPPLLSLTLLELAHLVRGRGRGRVRVRVGVRLAIVGLAHLVRVRVRVGVGVGSWGCGWGWGFGFGLGLG